MQSQCLLFLLLLVLSVKLLSAEFSAVSELSAEKFNGTKVFFGGGRCTELRWWAGAPFDFKPKTSAVTSLIHQLKLLPRCVWHAGWLLNQQFGHSASFSANTTVE